MTDLTTTEREPLVIRAAVTTAVTAVVHVAVVLGLGLSQEAELAIGGAVDALGLVVVLLWSRPSVTANAKVIARVNNDGQVVAGDAAVTPTGTELPAQRTAAGATIVGRVAVKAGLATNVLPQPGDDGVFRVHDAPRPPGPPPVA